MIVLDTDYSLEPLDNSSFTEGRCGKIIIDNNECGIIGEIHPIVLEKNQIWVPVVCFELELPYVPSLKCQIKNTFEE
jgi:phenylalanyl-tRNA synthetase beta chain